MSSDQVFQNRIRNNFDNLYRPELVKNRTLKSSGAAKGAGLEFFSLCKKFFVFDFEVKLGQKFSIFDNFHMDLKWAKSNNKSSGAAKIERR